MESRTVDLEGPVHYVDYGGAGSPMLLVHGLGGSHLNWAAVGPSLARRHHVVALDLAGFGRTPLGSRRATLAANATLIGQFIDAVLGAKVTLVGNSMGGLLAMMVAAAGPQRVRALLLVDAVHAPTLGVRPDPQVTALFTLYLVPWLGHRLTRARVARMGPETLDPGLVDAHVALERDRRAMAWSHDAFVAAARSVMYLLARPGSLRRIAGQVAAPTLVIHGDRDRLAPLGTARAAATRHGWDLEILEGIGHVPQLEAPERFTATVEAWLERLG
jgi:pimeloyl-ACP methyl ester carboxylesterase